ncbi:alpha/beta hydrolase-fold protein [Segetibacter aerophilus]|uniref:Phosphonate ABC transporter ATP-binding protein n=1 Tax=Segetibacter aerophilus TaxID=670293 RepID=A0A512BA62_9BACT|nr:alpha/beta hydrolase-fold protein [Segetibacter aerophilus]GEO08828.1 phosphonate ABC transporter ATP-binding protein [Segetibacter aerophilus]
MKHFLVALLFFIVGKESYSQYTVRLVVNEVGAKKLDDIYVTGNFNNWNPRDEKYKLKPFGLSRRAIILKDVAPGKYEFKFTRGGFDKVETTAKGEDVPNHEIIVKEDVAQDFNVPGWKDDYPDKPKPNTATAQVKVLDTAFVIPQLDRKRRIWVYLPKSYATGTKKYPVIYMHDGQNLFNEQTAPFGEWGIDEALDTLTRRTGKEAIIIGVDNGGDKRMTEYNPYDFKNYGKGEGSKYVDFLALTLKPFIDKKFRTLKDSTHTFVAGSSMGGLISLYAVIKYPEVFGGAGIFSPAFWTAPAIYDEVAKADLGRAIKRFYFYAGGKESEAMVPDMDKMIATIEKKGNYETRRLMNPLGKHNEATWRKEFVDFYQFIIR